MLYSICIFPFSIYIFPLLGWCNERGAGAGLVLTIGDPFLPPFGPCWTLLLIWSTAHIGGYIVQKVRPSKPSTLNPISGYIVS